MMKKLNVSADQFKYLQFLLQSDADAIANDISFFDDIPEKINEYIDERIALCKVFEINFWEWVHDSCSDYEYKRLLALYDGITEKEFDANYETPTETELLKGLQKTITRKKG